MKPTHPVDSTGGACPARRLEEWIGAEEARRVRAPEQRVERRLVAGEPRRRARAEVGCAVERNSSASRTNQRPEEDQIGVQGSIVFAAPVVLMYKAEPSFAEGSHGAAAAAAARRLARARPPVGARAPTRGVTTESASR